MPCLFLFGLQCIKTFEPLSWVCVCVLLTSRVFVRLTKETTYLTGNEGQNFRTFFSETALLQSYIEREKANMQIQRVWSIRVLCVSRRHHKMQRRACIASRMLSSSVVSPRQTLRELARDHAKTKPSPSINVTRMRLLTRAHHNAPRVCTSLLFIDLVFVSQVLHGVSSFR